MRKSTGRESRAISPTLTGLEGIGLLSETAQPATRGDRDVRLTTRDCAVTIQGMSYTAEMPWPVPDERFRHWASQFADMHDLVRDLLIPPGLPQAAESVLTTARELIRMSYYRYEFMMVGAATSIIAIETALTERYGKGTLASHLKKALSDGHLTEEQYELLDTTGRPIRNSYAHGVLTHAALTPPMAIGIVRTTISILAELHAPPASGASGETNRH